MINAGRREAMVGDREIQLAPKEFELLWELLDHRGLVLTRDQLLERVWGYTFAGDTRTVDVHVRQIRRKLEDASPIVTVWGVGYKVAPGSHRPRLRRLAIDVETPRTFFVLGSLRFRLPALFLLGIVLAGVVAALISLRLFQTYTRGQSVQELQREASGLSRALRRRGAAGGRRGIRRDRLRRVEARARDGRPHLLRRRLALPGPGLGAEAARRVVRARQR